MSADPPLSDDPQGAGGQRAARVAPRPVSAAVVVEDALGHVTHARALGSAAAGRSDLKPCFVKVPYVANDWPARLPGLPFSARMSIRANAALAKLPDQPDVLFFHTQALLPACWSRIAQTPTVISLDATPAAFESMAAAYDSTVATGLLSRVKHAMYRRLFARADRLVAMSDWARAGLEQDYGVDAARIAVVPPGVDTREFAPTGDRLDGGLLRLLFVGGDFVRKGGETLLQAWRAGLSADCELDIVSRDVAVAPGPGLRVHTGLKPGDTVLRNLFAQADVFIHPSHGDASPFAIIEAMSSGLPVIATAVGAVGEMVEHGRNGFVVPRGDGQALFAAVRTLSEDRARRAAMGQAARATVLERFDGRRNAGRVLDIVAAAARRTV